jgi:hypothetical protein
MPFRVNGIEPYQLRGLVVWNEGGQIRFKTREGQWLRACQVPMVGVDQVVAAGAEIYVVGASDASSRAVLRTNQECEVLERWSLPKVWADLVLERGSPIIVTDEGIAPLRPGGELGPMAKHVRSGPSRRATGGMVHWLSFGTGSVLCRNRDQSLRGSAPGWCALQQADGWLVTGEFTAAISCAGYVFVRESVDAERVRWTSLSPATGQKVAEAALPRGITRCVDDRLFLSADKAIRLYNAKTLRPLSSAPASDTPIEVLAVSPEEFVSTNGDGRSLRIHPRRP